jgi:signal transduction histidine kinase
MSSIPETDMSDISDFFDVIRNNADRLIRMVNNTLDLERIESGAVEMHCRDLNIIDLINEAITGFHALAEKKKVGFKVPAGPGLFIHADEDMVKQVLINLISNALNANPEDSEIEITVSASGKGVTTFIKDRGHGIPEEEKESIFEKYYTKRRKGGTGLGLAICKGVIDAHKGEIGVFDNEDGAGSTFYFTIPGKGGDV